MAKNPTDYFYRSPNWRVIVKPDTLHKVVTNEDETETMTSEVGLSLTIEQSPNKGMTWNRVPAMLLVSLPNTITLETLQHLRFQLDAANNMHKQLEDTLFAVREQADKESA